jgi:hypothetical protein
MSFRKLSTSLLATTGIVLTSAPAFAGPFNLPAGGVFVPPITNVIPGAIGNVTPTPATPTAPAPAENGNSEVQGLGDHDSWVSQDVLAEDPRALCSDVGLGSNTVATTSSSASSYAESSRNINTTSSAGGGGGGFSFLGIGASGSGSSNNSGSSDNSSANNGDASDSQSSESSTVVVGRDCGAFVEAAAARDMNFEDNLTERYRINVDRRGDQVDNLLE